MLDPTGRVAMVSGASRGIGRAVAERLVAAGYVVSAGVRDPAAAPPGTSAHRYDAEDDATAAAWVAATVAAHGRVDALVNAAGINPMARFLDADETAHDAMWRVNVKGPMRLVRHAWPHLLASGEGRVVNVASLSGKRVAGGNGNAGYALSKFAVMALTGAIRGEGWAGGIRATAICPGFVDTDMTAHVAHVPRDQMTRPEDVAELVLTALRLPNTATVGEMLVNWRLEPML